MANILSEQAVGPAIPSHLFTPETAREMGRKGGKASAASRSRTKSLSHLRENPTELFNELYKAAFGRDEWSDLPMDKRLQALNKLIEYAVGRPTPMKEGETAEPDGGFEIGMAEV